MDDKNESGSMEIMQSMTAALTDPYCQWDEDNYDTLIDAIREGNCILMLGPDASTVEVNGKQKPLTEILANKLAEKLSPEIKSHIDISDLGQVSQYYVKEYSEKDLLSQVKKFYQGHHTIIPALYNDLAALPFHFIITTAFDSMFLKALSNQNKLPNIGWFDFNKKQQEEFDMGNPKNPLVFYLYGYPNKKENNHPDKEENDHPDKKEESLLLTETDLLVFLKTLIKGTKPGLQDSIRAELQGDNKVFLFFGFGFRHWYLRLLLHLLREWGKSSRSFALEQYEPGKISSLQLQETVFFFKKCDAKIHIFKEDFQQIACKLRREFEKSDPPCKGRLEKRIAPEVFICHAHENKEHAADFHKKFTDAGLSPWLDNINIEPGDKWEKCIEKAISKVDYFVVLLSEALNNGKQRYAIQEIEMALAKREEDKRKKFIFPVLIEKCAILENLKDIHAVDLTVKTDITPLIDTIKRDFAKRWR